MRKILLSLIIVFVLACENPADNSNNNNNNQELTSTVIKGSIVNSNSRSLPEITHVAAIPVTDNYSPQYIVENLTPILVDVNGEYEIEGIETNVIIVLLNIIDGKPSVVDFVTLQQGEEGLMLLPIEGIDPTEIDLGEIDYSGSASAVSDLLPESFSDLEDSQILELASLDDVYRNIENHINNSSEVEIDGGTQQQVFYLKPELGINNSIKDLYSDLDSGDVLKNSEYDYTLVQFAALPIEHTVDEIVQNFSITNPDESKTYTCPELTLEGGISDEGHLFTKRYTAHTDTVNMMFEYCWGNRTDAENNSDNHEGNVNFFRPEIEGWEPEQGKWKYNWGNETYAEFDVRFAQVYDDQGKFQGYFPKPELVYDEDNKLTEINIEWYHQQNGVLTQVTDLTIAETLMATYDVELATYTYNQTTDEWDESANHINNPGLTNVEILEDAYLIDGSIINEMDDISVEDSTELQDGRTYVERIYIMYSLGNELAYTFVWSCHIQGRD